MKMFVTNLLLVCCLVGIALAKTEAEVKNWFMEQGVSCINDYPVTDGEMLLMDKHTIPDSKSAKCFLTCLFKKVAWMDDQGKFSEENALKTAELDHVEEPAKIDNAKKLFALCKTGVDVTAGKRPEDTRNGKWSPSSLHMYNTRGGTAWPATRKFYNIATETLNDESFIGADSDCERGASLAQCLIDNAPKMGFTLP